MQGAVHRPSAAVARGARDVGRPLAPSRSAPGGAGGSSLGVGVAGSWGVTDWPCLLPGAWGLGPCSLQSGFGFG
jgi:hypothetical protein